MGGAEPLTTDEDVVCFRCGGRAEAGFVAAFRQLRWSAGDRWARWLNRGDEMLARSVGTAYVAAHRCKRCRLFWFSA